MVRSTVNLFRTVMKEVILKQFFAPIKARFRLLLIFPVLNLLVLSIVLLFLKSPKEAVLLAMGGISFIVFLIGSKKFVSLFYYSSILFNLIIFFITWGNETPWTKIWSISMMITLTVGYYLSTEVLDFFYKEERDSKENETEKGLWKNRFETLRDAHNLELVSLEEELNKSLEGFTEKNKQIEALEKLVEVTHKEAGILSKQKHELLDKIKCQDDGRNDEEIKRQNLILEKEIERLSNFERDVAALREEKGAFIDKISSLQESNRAMESDGLTIDALNKEIEALKEKAESREGTTQYSPEDIFKMIQDLNFFRTEKFQLEQVKKELKEKLNFVEKPFKWQVWKGERKEKKEGSKKMKISMTDLGKGLKI